MGVYVNIYFCYGTAIASKHMQISAGPIEMFFGRRFQSADYTDYADFSIKLVFFA
jgi:hypothetical protein